MTGVQNGFALAGDYMSAASFLGISGMVALKGFDGMIYATGWLVGWPALMFLVAEPLRNLGKFTFAGNKVVNSSVLRPMFKLTTGEYYDAKKIR